MQVLASATSRRCADPLWADVLLLMPMETDFADAKNGTTVIQHGSPVVSAAVNAAPFGTNSGQFAMNDYLELPDVEGILSGNSWTVEFWTRNPGYLMLVLPSHAPNAPYYFGNNSAGGGSSVRCYGPQAGWLGGDGDMFFQSYALTPIDEPVHLAFVMVDRSATPNPLFRVYINGVGEEHFDGGPGYGTTPYTGGIIGGDPDSNYWLNGPIKALRVTAGARYTADFTPPTGPFPQG